MNKPLSKMSRSELWILFPIELTAPNPCWQDWYEAEQASLQSFLPTGVQIYHIGSTAIHGIWAKPIVDILVEAPFEEYVSIKQTLLHHGYLCMAQTDKRLDFNKGYTPHGFAKQVFHLHLRVFGDDDELYFCHYLNQHLQIAKEYEQLKLSLWHRYEHDRDGYTAQKTDFIRKVTTIARGEITKK